MLKSGNLGGGRSDATAADASGMQKRLERWDRWGRQRVRNALRSASTNIAFCFTLNRHLTWPSEPRLKQCMPSVLDPIPWIFAHRKTGDMEKLWREAMDFQ